MEKQTHSNPVPAMSNSKWVQERSDRGVWSSFFTATFALEEKKKIQTVRQNENNWQTVRTKMWNASSPAWMLSIIGSIAVDMAIGYAILRGKFLWLIMEYNTVLQNCSSVRSRYGCCIVLVMEQTIQLRPHIVTPSLPSPKQIIFKIYDTLTKWTDFIEWRMINTMLRNHLQCIDHHLQDPQGQASFHLELLRDR